MAGDGQADRPAAQLVDGVHTSVLVAQALFKPLAAPITPGEDELTAQRLRLVQYVSSELRLPPPTVWQLFSVWIEHQPLHQVLHHCAWSGGVTFQSRYADPPVDPSHILDQALSRSCLTTPKAANGRRPRCSGSGRLQPGQKAPRRQRLDAAARRSQGMHCCYRSC